MKRNSFLLILITMFLTTENILCACGNSILVPLPTKEQETASSDSTTVITNINNIKDATTFSKLTDSQQSNTPDKGENNDSQHTNSTTHNNIEKVEIDTNNFFEYFEYVELPQNNMIIEEDLEGNRTRIIASSGFYLKETHKIAKERENDCNVDIRVTYTRYGYRWLDKAVKTDLDNCNYEIIGKKQYETNKHDEIIKGLYSPEAGYYIWIGSDTVLNSVSAKIIDSNSIVLVSASGVLYLIG